MTPVFLDSGYIIALESSDDQNHSAAVRHWKLLRHRLPQLVTHSLVFAEMVTFFNARGHHAKAVEVGNLILESPRVTLLTVDENLLRRGWDLMQQHADKSFSLADCVSFAIMRERGISKALSFDRHFVQAGFEKLP
jgi:predicted nucleic acid-binding protein